MPSAAPSTAISRRDIQLSVMDYDLDASQNGFIGMEVLPVYESDEQSGKYPRFPLNQLLQDVNTERAPMADYAEVDLNFTEASYATKEYGIGVKVDRRMQNIYKDFFRAETVCGKLSRDLLLRGQERRIANMVFNPTTFTGAALTTAVAVPWSTISTAQPRNDVRNAKLKVRANCGWIADTLIISYETAEYLKDCASIIDRLKYAGITDPNPRNITANMLAFALDIETVLIGGAIRNTANEMAAAASITDVWSKTMAMICRRNKPTDDLETAGFGRTFHWSGDGSRIGSLFESFQVPGSPFVQVRNRMEVEEKITYTNFGHLLTNVG